MLKRLRLNLMLIASLMVVFIGFSSVDRAMGQATEVCPDIPSDPGWILLNVSTGRSDFTDGLLGTVESFNGSNVAGLDWLTRDLDLTGLNSNNPANVVDFILGLTPTTQVGSQLVSWWSRRNGRNSIIQVTNTAQTNFCSDDGDTCTRNSDCTFVCTPATVRLHVQILGEDCIELRDFCDTLTPNDTVVYDLSNLVTNLNQNISTGILSDREGIVLITPVDSCPSPNAAIKFNFLQGNLRMSSNGIDEYGVNVFARNGENFRGRCSTTTNRTCVVDRDCPGSETCNVNFTGCPTERSSGIGFSTLNGLPGCNFQRVVPNNLQGSFGTIGGGSAAADLVLISFRDSYGPPYNLIPGSATYGPSLFDDIEQQQSCSSFSACFARFGLNDTFPISEDFSPIATPTPSPTPIACSSDAQCPSGFVCMLPTPGPGTPAPGTPAPGVCVPITTPTASPTRTPGGGGGGGGCSIGGPAEIGTAMANILVPLVPAFAIGFRVLRRRAKKNQK